MTHDEISRFFSEEAIKKAFQFPDWPAGTEIVCYCHSTDNRDTIEHLAVQQFNYNNGEQSFRGRDANLIIVGDDV